MLFYPLSVLGLLVSGGLVVQMVPAATNNMNLWGLRIAFTVFTWFLTLLSVLVLADRGSFAFAGESKLGVVALHCFWGAACLLIALGLVPVLINMALLLPSLWHGRVFYLRHRGRNEDRNG